MKRPLLASGAAVLLSMMLVPRGDVEVHRSSQYEGSIRELLPFFVESHWWHPLWRTFIMQTIFLAILAAVIVNIRRRGRPSLTRTRRIIGP
jgi:hypothetical protein